MRSDPADIICRWRPRDFGRARARHRASRAGRDAAAISPSTDRPRQAATFSKACTFAWRVSLHQRQDSHMASPDEDRPGLIPQPARRRQPGAAPISIERRRYLQHAIAASSSSVCLAPGKTTLLTDIARRAAENAGLLNPLAYFLARSTQRAQRSTGLNALRDIALSQVCGSDWELLTRSCRQHLDVLDKSCGCSMGWTKRVGGPRKLRGRHPLSPDVGRHVETIPGDEVVVAAGFPGASHVLRRCGLFHRPLV